MRNDLMGVIVLAAGAMLGCGAPAAGPVPLAAPSASSSAETPSKQVALPVVRALAVGRAHSCAVWDDGSLRCWGANEFGQLGDGSQHARARAARVGGLPPVASVSAEGDHTCAVTLAGDVYCWGLTYGEWADLDRGRGFSSVPRLVEGLQQIQSIALGSEYGAALDKQGKAFQWGGESFAPVWPDRTVAQRRAASPSALNGSYRALAVGRSTLCGATANGLECVRLNLYPDDHVKDCLGPIGGEAGCQPFALNVSDASFASIERANDLDLLDDAICVAHAAGDLDCARRLRDDAAIEPKAWGPFEAIAMPPLRALHGGLGLGADGSVFQLRLVEHTSCSKGGCPSKRLPLDALTRDASLVALGAGHACAVRGETILCWGDNGSGQLGNGTRSASAEATPVKDALVEPAPAPNTLRDRLVAVRAGVPKAKLKGFAFIWANSELFEAPREDALVGRLADYDDDLLLELGQPRWLVAITEDRGDFVSIAPIAPERLEQHCGWPGPDLSVGLRGFVRRSAFAPTVTERTPLAFEDGSLALLPGTPLILEQEGFSALAFGEPHALDVPAKAIGYAYAAPLRQNILNTAQPFSFSLGGQAFRARDGRGFVTLPEGDDSDDAGARTLPTRVAHRCTTAYVPQVTFLDQPDDVPLETAERGYSEIAASAAASYPSGGKAGKTAVPIQFWETPVAHGKRLCVRAIGSVELCFAKASVAPASSTVE